MKKGHGGNIYALAAQLGCDPQEVIDMSSNVNPLGPPDDLIRFLKSKMETIAALPEVDSHGITAAFAHANGLDSSNVIAGNGTTQFIYALPNVLEFKKPLIIGPTYSDYTDACRLHGIEPVFYFATHANDFIPDLNQIASMLKHVDAVWLCNPNNPSGSLIKREDLSVLCRTNPNTIFIIDESYLAFTNNGDGDSICNVLAPNVVVLNSMSKIYGIPGLRIGFIIAASSIIARMADYIQPWSVNSLAQTAVGYLMHHSTEIAPFIARTRAYVEKEKHGMYELLRKAPNFKCFPSTTDFVLIRLPDYLDSGDVCSRLAEKKYLIRDCSNFKGLSDRFIRISLKSHAANLGVIQHLIQLD